MGQRHVKKSDLIMRAAAILLLSGYISSLSVSEQDIEAAIRKFQADKELKQTGRLDRETREFLELAYHSNPDPLGILN